MKIVSGNVRGLGWRYEKAGGEGDPEETKSAGGYASGDEVKRLK